MYNINRLNYILTGLPVACFASWPFAEGGWVYGALLSILTGFFHMVMGLCLFADSNFKDTSLRIYFSIVTAFFIVWWVAGISILWLWPVPIALAGFMSIYLYKQAKT